ncbi:MAG TPA: glycosyltransferase, partial [Actinomycetota bacterium]
MRIGLICHAGFGGSVRIAVELAESLGRRGHEVHLFSRRSPLGRSTFEEGVVVHSLNGHDGEPPSARLDTTWSRTDLRTFSDLVAGVVEQHRLDVLHFHYAVPFAPLVAELRSRWDGHA